MYTSLPRMSKQTRGCCRDSVIMVTSVRKNKKLHDLLQHVPEGAILEYRPDKLKLGGKEGLFGIREGSHIKCLRCNSLVNASKFEKHAGFEKRRKPYSYIYVVSTGELLDNTDNSGCRSSGLLDDASRRDTHAERIATASDLSDGSEDGKIVKETSCCLCRKTDFTTEFGPRTILICDQCEREYHVGCFNEDKDADLKEVPIDDWFCSVGCKTIHNNLHDLLNRSFRILESITTNYDVRWRLLKSPLCFAIEENKQLFAQAINVLEEGFGSLPCNGVKGGLLRRIVNGGKVGNKLYRGMYCAVLLVDSNIVSAAIFRIFGREFAELPLVSTLSAHKRKGHFHTNFNFIQNLCKLLEVNKIVLPATNAAMGLWLKLGFERMTADQLSKHTETFPDVVEFNDTVMMQLRLSSGPNAANDAEVGASLNGI